MLGLAGATSLLNVRVCQACIQATALPYAQGSWLVS